MGESSHLTDIYDIIKKYAKSCKQSKDFKGKVDWENFGPANINITNLVIDHGDAVYDNDNDRRKKNTAIPKQKSYVLFSSVFTNDTDQPQTYSLQTKRRTTSTTKIAITNGITVGQNLTIGLTPPNPVVTANTGFKREVTLQDTGEDTLNEELEWSVDTQINVPDRKKIKAELMIEEEDYEGTFRVETVIKGKLKILLKDKEGNVLAPIQVPDIREVFKTQDGFEHIGESQVKFVSTGWCRCRYGIQQRVILHQMPLDGENGSI